MKTTKRNTQPDYTDKLGYAMGVLASALIGIITIVYIVLFAL